MRVKGTMILDYARIIRANRDKDWSKYLKPEDWIIIEGQVLPSNWYPYDSFNRIAFAVFKVIGGGKMEAARAFGRYTIKNLLDIYKNILVPGDPFASVDKLAKLRRTFFNGDVDTRMGEHGQGFLIYHVIAGSLEQDREKVEAFCNQIAGNLEEIAEQAGGKNVKAGMEANAQGAQIKVTWD
jgi:hypothetical protein